MLSRRLLRIKAVKALYSHFKSEADSAAVSEKNLVYSVDKAYDLYLQMLWLPVEVKRYAEKRIELAMNKRMPTAEDLNPNRKFIENQLITQIENSDSLIAALDKRKLTWANNPELIKNLYNTLIATDRYERYMKNPPGTYREDVLFVEDFYLNETEDNEELENVIEEQSIMWADDLDFALIMVMRTFHACRPNQKDIPLLPQFKNEDDQKFFRELFRAAVVNYNEYLSYVDKFTRNWDVDRIAFMDHIILVTAIAELVNFSSVPVKVTLDEYIEIAKYYSTQGSGTFVNGVLDKVIDELTKEGKIKKSGRGLL